MLLCFVISYEFWERECNQFTFYVSVHVAKIALNVTVSLYLWFVEYQAFLQTCPPSCQALPPLWWWPVPPSLPPEPGIWTSTWTSSRRQWWVTLAGVTISIRPNTKWCPTITSRWPHSTLGAPIVGPLQRGDTNRCHNSSPQAEWPINSMPGTQLRVSVCHYCHHKSIFLHVLLHYICIRCTNAWLLMVVCIVYINIYSIFNGFIFWILIRVFIDPVNIIMVLCLEIFDSF